MFRLRIKHGRGADAAFDRMVGITRDVETERIWPMVVRDVVHPWVLEKTKENIDSHGALVGESWDYAGEPKYRAYKQMVVGHNKVLRWAGGRERLYPSLTSSSHGEHLFDLQKTSATIGSRVPYADRLTQGGSGPFGEDYPGRTIMPGTPDLNKRLATQVQRYINDQLDASGGSIRSKRFNL